MAAPPNVEDLVCRFEEQRSAYQSSQYNETQVRREFLDPLFESLGWDVANKAGLPEAFKDVIHEERLLVGGALRAPDYSFRLGGQRQFLLEAKKPSVNLRDAPSPAFQLRRYAWSAKLPVSILSDFEELAVYDCRREPAVTDEAATGRLLYFTFPEYVSRWSEICDLFSRDAVIAGSLEIYRQSLKVRRGTAEVDGSFLREIESWRQLLAKNMAETNRNLTEYDLNFAVQQTIDRLVFLRIAEDRGLEPYGSLTDTLRTANIYKQLLVLFHRADSRYNSGLFHLTPEASRVSQPDLLTPEISISDETLEKIIGRLYYPDSPYEFSVIPTRVLGQVYEQFLGEVITLDARHRATVDKKPEVKKAGGVYYTPSQIVDLVVESTVGSLIANRTPAQISGESRGKNSQSPLRILDPACGSGSFLIGSYEYLLNWYLQVYLSDPKRWSRGRNPRLVTSQVGDWRLSTEEKKRILRTHIFGVDIDPQAVEVTKLSLVLKVLESESEASFQQLAFHRERALPDLDENIKCGNSLVDLDIYSELQLDFFDEERRRRLNAFSWKQEFPAIMKTGGFDVVLGNPPYVDSELMTQVMPEVRTYCTKHFVAASGNWDLFCVFVDRALSLCRPGGRHGFIVPNKLASAEYAKGARQALSERAEMLLVRDYSRVEVFPVAVYPLVYVAERSDAMHDGVVEVERMEEDASGLVVVGAASTLDRVAAFAQGTPWLIYGGTEKTGPLKRLRDDFATLADVAEISGAATVAEAYQLAELVDDGDVVSDPGDLKMVNSGTIDPYVFHWADRPLRYLKRSYTHAVVPRGKTEQVPTRRLEQARSPKVVLAGMTRHLEAACDLNGEFLAGKSTTVVISDIDPRILAGLLNSKLVDWFYSAMWGGNRLQGGYLRIGPPQVRKIPVPDFSSQHIAVKQLQNLVDAMISLQKKLLRANTPNEQTQLERLVYAQQESIDGVVMELYGLSEAEIATVCQDGSTD